MFTWTCSFLNHHFNILIWFKDNIKVISVHPGAIDTAFWDDISVDFPREEMLSPEMIAASVVHAVEAPGTTVIENLTIRRVGGDF